MAIQMASNGNVAGYFFDSGGGTRGYLRTADGTATIIDAPGAVHGVGGGTVVSAVNTSETVTGTYYGADQLNHAFSLSANGQLAPLPAVMYTYLNQFGLPQSAYTSNLSPTAINDDGIIAGYFYDPLLGVHAFIIPTQGQPISYGGPAPGVPPGFGTWVHYLSPAGDIVGDFRDSQGVYHGFIRHYSDGTVTTLDAPGYTGTALAGTSANWIGAAGTVVGSVFNSSQVYHSFVRTPDGIYTIFDPPGVGPMGSTAFSVNASGVIAGNFTDANSIRHGYLRNADGSFTIIDDPEAAQIASLGGTIIFGFNDAGVVAGLYWDVNGLAHAYIRQ